MSDGTPVWHGTTILSIRKGEQVVIAGDGQVSLGDTVIKGSARKVGGWAMAAVIGGFAGATADAFTVRAPRGQVRAVSWTTNSRLRGDGQRLAHRPLPSAPGSNDGRC